MEVQCLTPDSAGVEEYLDTIYLQLEVTVLVMKFQFGELLLLGFILSCSSTSLICFSEAASISVIN